MISFTSSANSFSFGFLVRKPCQCQNHAEHITQVLALNLILNRQPIVNQSLKQRKPLLVVIFHAPFVRKLSLDESHIPFLVDTFIARPVSTNVNINVSFVRENLNVLMFGKYLFNKPLKKT